MLKRSVLCLVFLGLSMPGVAGAATTVRASVDGAGDTTVIVNGDAGPNAVGAQIGPGPTAGTFAITVADLAGLGVGPGCEATGPGTARCLVKPDSRRLRADLGAGDDALTLLPETGPKTVFWEQASVFGGEGDDRLETQLRRYSSIHANAELSGGTGNDVLQGGPTVDSLSGDAGDDVLRGEGRGDTLAGNGGADQLYGGPGNDGLDATTDDPVIDMGEGDDEIEVYRGKSGDTPITCGGGEDNVFFEIHDAPGLLLDADCEDAVEIQPSPVRVRGDRFTWNARCYTAGPCSARFQVRYQGKLVASRRFSSRVKTVPVTLRLPRALVSAMRRDYVVLEMRIAGFLYDKDEYDGPTVRRDAYWRTRIKL